jgi:hypothetical protein
MVRISGMWIIADVSSAITSASDRRDGVEGVCDTMRVDTAKSIAASITR